MLLALTATVAGCLLSPDEMDRSALTLRVIAREPAVAKSPCGDPVTLLAEPTEDLLAVARVYRADADVDERGEVIATANLTIAEYDAATTSREMTGVLELPLGPAGKTWSIEVELLYDGPVGRDALGEYAGSIRLDSGLMLNGALVVDTDLGGGAHGGSVGVSFGNLTGGAPVDPILYDPDLNLMEFGYVSDPIEWNDDPEDLREIEVLFTGSFGPSVIYRAEEVLPDLVPGPVPVELPTIVLTPLSPAPLALELEGRVDVHFTDGRAPSEQGTVKLTRFFTGCD